MNAEVVLAKIETLPDESRRLLLELVNILAERADAEPRPGPKHAFNFNWEGRLGDAYEGITSVELQHRATEWR